MFRVHHGAKKPGVRVRHDLPARASSRSKRPTPALTGPVDVVAVIVTKRPWLADYVGRKLAWQTHRPAVVVVCTAVPDYDVAPIKRQLPGVAVHLVVDRDQRVLGDLRNFAMSSASKHASERAILCSVDDDDLYGRDYFEGIVDAWRRHPDASIVGRASWARIEVTAPPADTFSPQRGVRGGPIYGIAGATISIPAKVWRAGLRYHSHRIGEDIEIQRRITKQGRSIVSAYFGTFVAVRYRGDRHGHTSPGAK